MATGDDLVPSKPYELDLDTLRITDTTPVRSMDLMHMMVMNADGELGFNAMSPDHKTIFLLGFKKIKIELKLHGHVVVKTGGITLEIFHDFKGISENQLTLKRIGACLAAQNVVSYLIGKVDIADIPKCAFSASITGESKTVSDIISIGLTPGVAMTIELLNNYEWVAGTKAGWYAYNSAISGGMMNAICVLTAGAMVADSRAEKTGAKVDPNSLTKSILARCEATSKTSKCTCFGESTAKSVSTILGTLKGSTTKKDKLSSDWLRLVHGTSGRPAVAKKSTFTTIS